MMTRIETFTAFYPIELDRYVNEWLEENNHVEVLNIKFSMTAMGTQELLGAMILYQVDITDCVMCQKKYEVKSNYHYCSECEETEEAKEEMESF